MMDELRVNSRVAIPLSEIDLRAGPSSGPGGQHANRSSTRVDAAFDVAASNALSELQKRRVIARTGPLVTAAAQDARSQAHNRELALERLAGKLRAALTVAKPRTPTKPTKAAKQRRLTAKKQRGETKAARRRPPADDA